MLDKPHEKIFTLEEIPDLLSGKFHLENAREDNGDDKLPEVENQNTYLNRAIKVDHEDLAHEIKLEEFESAINNVVYGQQNSDLKKKFEGDHIPSQIKKELNLPKVMQNYEINFDEVRNNDAMYPKRNQEWSG